jgi:hypothetical protein
VYSVAPKLTSFVPRVSVRRVFTYLASSSGLDNMGDDVIDASSHLFFVRRSSAVRTELRSRGFDDHMQFDLNSIKHVKQHVGIPLLERAGSKPFKVCSFGL